MHFELRSHKWQLTLSAQCVRLLFAGCCFAVAVLNRIFVMVSPGIPLSPPTNARNRPHRTSERKQLHARSYLYSSQHHGSLHAAQCRPYACHRAAEICSRGHTPSSCSGTPCPLQCRSRGQACVIRAEAGHASRSSCDSKCNHLCSSARSAWRSTGSPLWRPCRSF